MEKTNDLILDVHDKPKSKVKWALLSFQHVFAMFGATILVPLLTGLDISVALFASGIGTLIYILCTKAKVPVYLGSSFAYISVIATGSGYANYLAVKDSPVSTPEAISEAFQAINYGGVLTGLFMVGLVYIVISLLVRAFGKNWIDKALPPVVIGPAIMIIGLGLAGTAVSNTGFVSGMQEPAKMIVAIAAFLTVALVSIKCKGFFKIIPFLCAIVVGYVVAVLLQVTGAAEWMGTDTLINFDAFVNTIKNPGQWFAVPNYMFLGGANKTIKFGITTITINKVDIIAGLSVVPLAFVTACEHIGDHAVLGKIMDRDFLKDPGLDRTLLGDGIATSFAALVGGPANTTYGENTSVVGLTKVASVWVTGTAAVIAVILSFFNLFSEFIATLPSAVMGGMSIILYGFIAANGLRVLFDSKVNMAEGKNLIIVSAMLVTGIGAAAIGGGSFVLSGTAFAVILGVILNIFFNVIPESRKKNVATEETTEEDKEEE